MKIATDLGRLGATRTDLARLALFTALFAIFEGIGIGMLLPILQYAESPEQASGQWSSNLLELLEQNLGWDMAGLELPVLLALAFTALLLRSAFQYIRDLLAGRLRIKVATNLRQDAVEALVNADYPFLARHDLGKLINDLTVEAERAGEAMASRIVFLNAASLLAAYAALLVLVSPLLTLYMIPAVLVVAFVFRRQGRTAAGLGERISRSNTLFGREVSERLHGIRWIKLRGRERETVSSLHARVEEITSNLFNIERLRILVEIGIHPVLVLVAFGVLFVAIDQLSMSLATLGIFLFIMVRLIPQVTLMNSMWAHMHGCMASFDRLEELMVDARNHRERAGGPREFEKLGKEVRFEQVSFRYPDGGARSFSLHGVSFTLPRGSTTAIVGHSGAGKSTLVYLLAGFFQPDGGEIRIDGVPLGDYNLASYRARIALVPQEPYLFNTKLRDNLLYGLKRGISDAEIEAALEASQCLGFVQTFPEGLSAQVGERGGRLSQGQRQRVALAHALLTLPELLILDEPTSALDPESEEAISKALIDHRGEVTTVVIAHRLSTIQSADQILLLDGGSVVAAGSHDELVRDESTYRRLFRLETV